MNSLNIKDLAPSELKDIVNTGYDSDTSTVVFANDSDMEDIGIDCDIDGVDNVNGDTDYGDDLNGNGHNEIDDHNYAFISVNGCKANNTNVNESCEHPSIKNNSNQEIKKRVVANMYHPPAKRIRLENDDCDIDVIDCTILHDRKLYLDCDNGRPQDKLKFSIQLQSPSDKLPTVWIGVTGCDSPIKTYISQKTTSNDFTTYFLDMPTFNALHDSFFWFICQGQYYITPRIDKKNTPTTNFAIVKDDKGQPFLILQHKGSSGKYVGGNNI